MTKFYNAKIMPKHFNSFCMSHTNYYFPINRHFKAQLIFWSCNTQFVIWILYIQIIDMS